jgi:hypothetical protein
MGDVIEQEVLELKRHQENPWVAWSAWKIANWNAMAAADELKRRARAEKRRTAGKPPPRAE